MTVRMVAVRHHYDAATRKEYAPGQTFSVDSEAAADWLERRKKAKREPVANPAPPQAAAQTPPPVAAPAPEPVAPVAEPAPGYATADMAAEGSGPDETGPTENGEPRAKRRYRRRDMQPEG